MATTVALRRRRRHHAASACCCSLLLAAACLLLLPPAAAACCCIALQRDLQLLKQPHTRYAHVSSSMSSWPQSVGRAPHAAQHQHAGRVFHSLPGTNASPLGSPALFPPHVLASSDVSPAAHAILASPAFVPEMSSAAQRAMTRPHDAESTWPPHDAEPEVTCDV